MKNPAELYERAAELLLENGWTSGYAHDKDGRMCGGAAILLAAGLPPNAMYPDALDRAYDDVSNRDHYEARSLLDAAAQDLGLRTFGTGDGWSAVMTWNDSPYNPHRGKNIIIPALQALAAGE